MDAILTSPLPILDSLNSINMDNETAKALRLYPDEVLQAADRQTSKKDGLDNPLIYFLGCCRGIYKDYFANGSSLPARYAKREFPQKGTSQSLPYQKPGYYEKLRQENAQSKGQTPLDREKTKARQNELSLSNLFSSQQRTWNSFLGEYVELYHGHPVFTDAQRAKLLASPGVQKYFKDNNCGWADIKEKYADNDRAALQGLPLNPVMESQGSL